MARILVIEDETALAEALARGLRDERYSVDVCRDGDTGLVLATDGNHDLLVLDLMLPGRDGMDVCRTLRRRGLSIPIMMLTARDKTQEIVGGLDAGANDYMTKPFVFEEFLARVRTLLRVHSEARSSSVEIADLTLDLAGRRVYRSGDEISVTAKEFQILEYMVLHRGRVLSKACLAEAAWNVGEYPSSNVIEVYIGNLRRKIDRGRRPRLIHTLRGAGYVLRLEPEA